MLPKTRRLDRASFIRTSQQGQAIRDRGLAIKAWSQQLGRTRFAVVISGRLARRAVDRNRLRRRLYRLLVSRPGSYDAILYPTAEVINFSDEVLGAVLDSVLSKVVISLSRSDGVSV